MTSNGVADADENAACSSRNARRRGRHLDWRLTATACAERLRTGFAPSPRACLRTPSRRISVNMRWRLRDLRRACGHRGEKHLTSKSSAKPWSNAPPNGGKRCASSRRWPALLRRLIGPLVLYDESTRPDFIRADAVVKTGLIDGLAEIHDVASPAAFAGHVNAIHDVAPSCRPVETRSWPGFRKSTGCAARRECWPSTSACRLLKDGFEDVQRRASRSSTPRHKEPLNRPV